VDLPKVGRLRIAARQVSVPQERSVMRIAFDAMTKIVRVIESRDVLLK
jgi:hypothetical protein